MLLTGRTISPGVVRGTTRVIGARKILASALSAKPRGSPQIEVERLHAAIGHACIELDRVQRQLHGRVGASDIAIFESHASLLRDAKFIQQIEQLIRDEGESAEAAVARVAMDLHTQFVHHPVALLQDKAADVLDIGRRLVHCLTGALPAEVEVGEATIVVAQSLTPSELVKFAHHGVVGVITETCGARSHTAILARGFQIPLITGITAACETIPDHAEVWLDANAHQVLLNPTAEERHQLSSLLSIPVGTAKGEDEVPCQLPITLDGVRMQVLLNISDQVEAEAVQHLGADGVGLFRTEFLYMDRPWWPSEDESFSIYQKIASVLGDAELNIRFVDFGAEKCPPYADFPMSRNPSLGPRGIRLLLQREDIFKPQVRALARLGAERPLTVLIPMLDTLDTLERTIDTLCRFVGCASRDKLPFQVGTMIEVPSAALMIDEIVEHVDSVSIGLNDLTQYMLAADRDDEFVERYHDPLQPAVLRLVRQIILAADRKNRPVTICGELAGDPSLTGLLLALGLRRLSVSRTNYAAVASLIGRIQMRSLNGVADEVLQLHTSAAVRSYITQRLGSPE